MKELILNLLLAIIPIVSALITAYVIPFLKAKIGNENLKQYKEIAIIAVKAAEMIFTESGMGKEKKQYVLDYLNSKINSDKTVISYQDLELLIEAAVKEMKEIEKNI